MKLNSQKALAVAPAVLVSLFLILASGAPKLLMRNQMMTDLATSMFGSVNILYAIGVLEIAIAILLLIPRTATLGFLMSVGLLGGALATGLTTNIEGMIWWFPLILLALLMLTAYFCLPELLDRVKGNPVPNTKSRGLKIFSWVLVVLLMGMHAMALMGKINPPAEGTPGYDMALSLGMVGLEYPLLIIEVLTIALFLIPRTSAIGAVLMIGYMSGVLADFLTHGLGVAGSAPGMVMLAVVGIITWIRNPELAQRLVKGTYPA